MIHNGIHFESFCLNSNSKSKITCFYFSFLVSLLLLLFLFRIIFSFFFLTYVFLLSVYSDQQSTAFATIVSEALFCLCRGTNNSTLFGVCPTFQSRTTAFIIFFFFSLWILIFAGVRKTQEDTL